MESRPAPWVSVSVVRKEPIKRYFFFLLDLSLSDPLHVWKMLRVCAFSAGT